MKKYLFIKKYKMEFANQLNNLIKEKIEDNKLLLNIIYKKVKQYKNIQNSEIDNKNDKLLKISDELDKLEDKLIENIYIINYNDSAYKYGENVEDKEYYEMFKYWLNNDYLVDYIENYIKTTINNIESNFDIETDDIDNIELELNNMEI